MTGAGGGAAPADGGQLREGLGDPAGTPALRVRGLGVRFTGAHRDRPVLRKVSFDLHPGETVALVGESGSGKSVTAAALNGLILEAGGVYEPGTRIEILGRPTVDVPDGPGGRRPGGRAGAPGSEAGWHEIRGGTLGMVFQDAGGALNPVRSVGGQLREVLARHTALEADAREARARELLAEVGLPDPGLLASYPHQLSGGMRQRVLIALALAGEPRILVADEATSALDATLQLQILDLIARLTRSRGLATLLVTHDFGVVARAADRVLVMYAGEVVEAGPTGPVLAAPQHPYTRALVDALPARAAPGQRLPVLPGRMPEPGGRRGGCLFRPRCPRGDARCRDAPSWTPRGPVQVRCWHPPGEATP